MLRSKELKALEEIDAMMELVRLQFVRRDRNLEVAHYRLPRTIIPFHQVMKAAGIGRDLQRTKTSFFKSFAEICAQTGDGSLSADELVALAKAKEGLFEGSDEGGLQPDTQSNVAEGFKTMKPESEAENEASACPAPHIGDSKTIGVEAFVSAKRTIEPQVAKVPVKLEAEVAKAKTIRSSGFGNCRTDKPFDAYRYSEGQAPFQFVPLRDAGPVKEPVGASIKPADFVRLEVCPSGYELEVVSDRSAVLGRCHELMLPNEPEAAVYGRRAGWSMPEARELLAFGSASRPEKIGSGGDWEKLDKALVGVAGLQLKALAIAQPSHLIADPAKASEAAEDLGRWWMFVMLVRLNPEKMMAMLPPGFLHGVHGPDVSIEDGRPVMGDSHIRIIDPVQERLELHMTDEEIVAEHGQRHVRRRLFDKV